MHLYPSAPATTSCLHCIAPVLRMRMPNCCLGVHAPLYYPLFLLPPHTVCLAALQEILTFYEPPWPIYYPCVYHQKHLSDCNAHSAGWLESQRVMQLGGVGPGALGYKSVPSIEAHKFITLLLFRISCSRHWFVLIGVLLSYSLWNSTDAHNCWNCNKYGCIICHISALKCFKTIKQFILYVLLGCVLTLSNVSKLFKPAQSTILFKVMLHLIWSPVAQKFWGDRLTKCNVNKTLIMLDFWLESCENVKNIRRVLLFTVIITIDDEDMIEKDQIQWGRIRNIIFFMIPRTLIPCPNLMPTLPKMQLNHSKFRLRFGCVVLIAATVASSGDEEPATEVWQAPLRFFSFSDL